MGNLSEQTFYEILEVSPEATQEEIVRAFQRAKSTYSPSSPALYSVFSREEAEELLKLINEAYAVLSNQTSRRTYDQSLFDKAQRNRASVNGSERDLTVIKGERPAAAASTEGNLAIPQAESTDWHSTDSRANATSPAGTFPQVSPKPETIVGSEGVSQVRFRRVEGSASGPGMARTKFSEYEVNPEIEKEIAAQEIFDGPFLQKIRNYKRVTLDNMCEYTRVGRHYLMAVEANDFKALPAAVFVRGFVCSIAKVLGLEEKKVADSFMKLFKQNRES